MADFTATFEAGVNGATITTGAGEASATAWDAVSGSPTYDNAHAHSGTLSAKVTTSPETLSWNLPSPTEHYGRAYLYVTGNATNFERIMYIRQTGTMVAEILFSIGTTRLIIEDTGEAHNATSTNGLSNNQWVRIEWHVIHSATVGQIEVKIFNSPESTTATETLSSPASWNTGTAGTSFEIGGVAGGNDTFWIDDIVANATAWVGPVPVAAPQQLQPLRGGTGLW